MIEFLLWNARPAAREALTTAPHGRPSVRPFRKTRAARAMSTVQVKREASSLSPWEPGPSTKRSRLQTAHVMTRYTTACSLVTGMPRPAAREALITAPHGRPGRRDLISHTRRAQVAQTAPRDARQGRPAGRTRGADHSASWPARRDRTAQGTGRASTARPPRPMDATAQSVAGSSGRRCSQRLAADAAHRAAAVLHSRPHARR